MLGKISLQNRIYGTVKSFTLKGVLLTRDDYRTLAESRDMDEFITRLKNTRYLDAVSDLQKPYTAEKVEQALKTDLINYHAMMNRIARGSEALQAYFTRYMVWNLKLLLKSKALGKSEEEIRSKLNLRAEEIIGRRDVIIRALIAKDLDEAIASLAQTEFANDAQEAVRVYREKQDIQAFDTYLDHAFYSKLYSSLSNAEKEVRDLISIELDSYNMLSILRAKFWNLNEQQIQALIVGRSAALSRDTMQKLISAYNVQEALAALSNTSYRDVIPQQYTDDISAIRALEQALEQVIIKQYLATYLKPFREANILAAIKLRSIEVKNLSAIATGVEQKIAVDEIMKKVMIL